VGFETLDDGAGRGAPEPDEEVIDVAGVGRSPLPEITDPT